MRGKEYLRAQLEQLYSEYFGKSVPENVSDLELIQQIEDCSRRNNDANLDRISKLTEKLTGVSSQEISSLEGNLALGC